MHEALAAQLGPDTVVSFNVILNAEGQPEVLSGLPGLHEERFFGKEAGDFKKVFFWEGSLC